MGETTMEEFIPKVIEFWETAQKLKQHYPSVYATIVRQFGLEFNKKPLSEELLQKKLEVMIMQDEEMRNNTI